HPSEVVPSDSSRFAVSDEEWVSAFNTVMTEFGEEATTLLADLSSRIRSAPVMREDCWAQSDPARLRDALTVPWVPNPSVSRGRLPAELGTTEGVGTTFCRCDDVGQPTEHLLLFGV